MIIRQSIEFAQSIEQVWDLLTNPEMTKQYMFGSEIQSSWTVGSPITWKGTTEDGQAIIYVKGTILSYRPQQEVTFTMIDPNSPIQDLPANYIQLTYTLQAHAEGTRLLLTQGDFAKVENGQSRYEEAKKGWDMVIPLMKKLIAS